MALPERRATCALAGSPRIGSSWLRGLLVALLVLAWAPNAMAQQALGSIVSVLQEGPNTRISIEADAAWTVNPGAAGFVRGLLGESRSRTARFTVREVRGQRVEADVVEFRQVPVVGDPVLFTEGAVLASETVVTFGILRVSTNPSDAVVYVDGEEVGTAPVAIERPIGTTVQVAVELDGFRSRNQRVRVSRSDATLRYQLDPVRVGATLVLTTAPVGVEVVLNEESLGETPFRAFFDPGLVEFELRKDGFRPRNIVVEIPESGTVRRTDSLSLARSRLDLIADREALVVLDGDTLGLSPQEALGREPSTYAVWFLAPGFDPHVEYVVLSEPGEVREITATLSAPGSDVQVVAEPEGTQVLLDGVLLGPAPVRLRVPPGTYDVSVQSAEGLTATRPDPLVVEVGGGATDIAVRLGPGSEAMWVLGDELPALEPLPPAEPEPTVAAEEMQEAADTSPSPPPAPEPARWVVRLESDDRYPVQGGDTVLDEYVACVQENVPEDLSEPVRVALLIQTNRRGRVTETPTVVRGNEGWLVARATQCLRLLTFESEAADVFYDIEVVQE